MIKQLSKFEDCSIIKQDENEFKQKKLKASRPGQPRMNNNMQLKIMSKMSCRVMIWESCCLLEVLSKEL